MAGCLDLLPAAAAFDAADVEGTGGACFWCASVDRRSRSFSASRSASCLRRASQTLRVGPPPPALGIAIDSAEAEVVLVGSELTDAFDALPEAAAARLTGDGLDNLPDGMTAALDDTEEEGGLMASFATARVANPEEEGGSCFVVEDDLEAWRSRSAYDNCALPVEEDQADMAGGCDAASREQPRRLACYSLRPFATS